MQVGRAEMGAAGSVSAGGGRLGMLKCGHNALAQTDCRWWRGLPWSEDRGVVGRRQKHATPNGIDLGHADLRAASQQDRDNDEARGPAGDRKSAFPEQVVFPRLNGLRNLRTAQSSTSWETLACKNATCCDLATWRGEKKRRGVLACASCFRTAD